MCGIFGLLASEPQRLPDDAALARIAGDLAHRGPDASAHARLDGAAFVHTRLSLLDLHERANQPMWDESRRYCLIYNGEIYNFRELRRELEQNGCRFMTECDTEVLLQGLLREGTGLLPRLEGMFAFALYDTQERRLLLARDRFGIKPLVYAATEDAFCFASQTRPLRHCVRLVPNRYVLAGFVAGFDPPTQGMTLFDGVRTLQSGHYLEVDARGHLTTAPFFSVSDFANEERAAELAGLGSKVLVRRLDALLHEAVRKHMIADVDVGSLCSGGLDSSLITAIAARSNPDLVLFHADVVGRKSERKAAERLARHLGLELNCVPVDDAQFLSLIPETVLHYEAPFSYHPNSVPFLAVAQLVQRHRIKAILSGEGADEAFLGYAATRRREIARRLGRRDAQAGALLPGGELLIRLERQMDDARIAALGDRAVDPTALQLLGYHLRTLLHRNDRLGMAAGIEARFPLLDHDLVAFAANLSPRYKVRLDLRRWPRTRHPVTVKWLLRQVAAAYLPADLADRRKRGFPTTTLRRLRIGARYFKTSWLGDQLELSRAQRETLTRNAAPELLVRLMLADVWGRLLIEHEDLEAVRDRLLSLARVTPE